VLQYQRESRSQAQTTCCFTRRTQEKHPSVPSHSDFLVSGCGNSHIAYMLHTLATSQNHHPTHFPTFYLHGTTFVRHRTARYQMLSRQGRCKRTSIGELQNCFEAAAEVGRYPASGLCGMLLTSRGTKMLRHFRDGLPAQRTAVLVA
jgi:hypothetical protein